MHTLRTIDLVTQAVIALAAFALIAVFGPGITFVGELFLGILQIISALLNSAAMAKNNYKVRIKVYWILVAIALIPWLTPSDEAQTFSALASWGIAIYYWFIYRSFINYVSYRKELSTLVRNH